METKLIRVRCKGKTIKDVQCKRFALPGEVYCARHSLVSANREQTNTNFGKMLVTAMSGIIRDIVRSEVRKLIIQTKD